MSYRAFLAELLIAECDDRARHRSERRIKAAGFPREKSLRTSNFEANPNIDPAVIHTLAKCDWVRKGLPLCLIGDPAPARVTREPMSRPKPCDTAGSAHARNDGSVAASHPPGPRSTPYRPR